MVINAFCIFNVEIYIKIILEFYKKQHSLWDTGKIVVFVMLITGSVVISFYYILLFS